MLGFMQMNDDSRHVFAQALALPLDARARLAADLLDSLQESEAQVEAAWAEEIQVRVAAARSGDLESTDWRTVLDRIEQNVLTR